MTTHIMKIRPHFIEGIRSGTKRHEYRLATPERKMVKTGDRLVLISNQNPNDFVRAYIEDVNVYPDWDAAFEGRWASDFKGVFSRYEDLVKECRRFYSAAQVKTFGIIVYDIKADNVSYAKGRYLLDTNTIIYRESQNEVLPIVGKLYQWIDKIGGKKLFHPFVRAELEGYKDREVVEGNLKKLEAYEEILPIDKTDAFFEQSVGDFGDADARVDNALLLQVYSGRADFLITSDRVMLQKAERLYLRDRVFSPEEFVHLMEEKNPSLIDYEVLSIRKEKIGNLNVDDPFFDSLREDYGPSDFNAWLHRKSGEEAYIFRDEKGSLQSFLYLKQEHANESFADFDKPMPKQEWLKVGTFKNDSSGMRVGERFIKIIIDNAIAFHVDGIYVTLFEKKRKGVIALMELMKKWGFVPHCHKKNGELVLVKDMRHYDERRDPMFNYPLQKDAHKYMYLPIEPFWHGKLFPDAHLKHENVSIYSNEPCAYAIEKIYVCKFAPSSARPGDNVLIYRIGDYCPKKYHSAITGVAILQGIIVPKTEKEYLDLVKNKSVFSEEDLRCFYNDYKYRIVIKLLFLQPFERKVTLKRLYELGLFDEAQGNAPRISTKLTSDDAKMILSEGGVL